MIRSSGIKYKELVPGMILICCESRITYVIISSSRDLVLYQMFFGSSTSIIRETMPPKPDALFLTPGYDVEVI